MLKPFFIAMNTNIEHLLQNLSEILSKFYDEREMTNIIRIYFHDKFQVSGPEILNLTEHSAKIFETDIDRFRLNEPVQYITGKAWFYKSLFSVDNSVLIPRPETEELVDLIIKTENRKEDLKILDIGTGSGCIALSLAIEMRKAKIEAIDISEEALSIAEKNKKDLNVRNVSFIYNDFLNKSGWIQFGNFDVIVSNPPYISNDEKELMSESTLKHEPQLALFPGANDHLIFYRRIFEFATNHLNPGGTIYCELNEFRSEEIKKIIPQNFHSGQILSDINGKDRILKVSLK